MADFDTTIELDPQTRANVSDWLDGQYDSKTKEQIRALLRDNPQEIIDAFYTKLKFGTAGLRGIMGVGTNRMNRYTVAAATQGLANYLKQQSGNQLSVFIGYDSRHQSRFFAEEAARVLAGNGIKVYVTKDIRPTPLVSFGCRHHKCNAAIMVTASHNPAQYNGYKVYWNDGGQILPPHDKGIIKEVDKITDLSMIHHTDSFNHELIQEVGEEIDNAYYSAITPQQLEQETNQKEGDKLKIVYTSLHGTGITLMPEAMKRWGFQSLSLVEKQVIPNGDFPTTASPNPEEREALTLGIEQMEREGADLLIATDPDADRVGIAVRHNGETRLINGNQIAALLAEHVCSSLSNQKRLPEKSALIKTVVTTELIQAIADHYKIQLVNVLTGFKYIAEKIRNWESDPNGLQYLFGGEESYGYLLGTATRDKDAIIASTLIAETALQAKLEGKTLVDRLEELYTRYGTFVESLISIKFPETKAGKEQMQTGMEHLRNNPPKKFGSISVKMFEDYSKGLHGLPPANILAFWLEDGSKLMVRPSGTEPKVKVYGGTVINETGSINDQVKKGKEHLKALMLELENELKS